MVIARVDISGAINSRVAHQYLEVFSYIEKSKKVKGLILTVNSGGGDAASSEMLMYAVNKIRKIKPVFAVIEGVGASGAYWIASACTKIYAMNTSITGSIGVIGINPNVKELLNKIGVRMDIVKMGEYKDMLSPFSDTDMNGKEKYKEILEYSFSVFKSSVAQNRGLSSQDIDKVATGELFSPISALNLHLIDKLGNYDDAMNDLITSFGLIGKVKGYAPRRPMIERIVNSSISTAILDRFLRI